MNNENLKVTSLHSIHQKLNAKMAPFAGFDMPLQYTSVKDEVLAVRNNCGIFDVSHMGEFIVTGEDTVAFVDNLVTNNIAQSPIGKAIYSPLCRHDGTVIDDLIVYKLNNTKILICVNASNIEKDWNWINAQKKNFKIDLKNKSDDYSLLAIQGPKTEKFISELGLKDATNMEYYSAQTFNHKDEEVIMARTGYTGEDGFEIFCSHRKAIEFWNNAVSLGVTPCGLASRDVLRLEVGFPLYGNELRDDWTPIDSGLKWTVKFDKNDFIGKSNLHDLKPKRKLVKIISSYGIPRSGYSIENEKGDSIGFITSGTHSVVLDKGIAFASLEIDKFKNEKIYINIRNKKIEAEIVNKAFVTGGHK